MSMASLVYMASFQMSNKKGEKTITRLIIKSCDRSPASSLSGRLKTDHHTSTIRLQSLFLLVKVNMFLFFNNFSVTNNVSLMNFKNNSYFSIIHIINFFFKPFYTFLINIQKNSLLLIFQALIPFLFSSSFFSRNENIFLKRFIVCCCNFIIRLLRRESCNAVLNLFLSKYTFPG